MLQQDSIRIRPLTALEEMYEAVELQKIYWGTEIESVVPAHTLFSIVNTGGHVIAAVDDEQMIGVLIGLFGMDIHADNQPATPNLLIASKRMVVLPDYRGSGLGYALKLHQRELALAHGLKRVTWTFDPLISRNAHLNIRKLGCISHKYLQNYYGTDDSKGLAKLGASDRLYVEWWIDDQSVRDKLTGMHPSPAFSDYQAAGASIINPTWRQQGLLYPPDDFIMPTPEQACTLIEIPMNHPEITEQNPALAIAWRQHTRAAFLGLMQAGYIVTDFIRHHHEGHDRAFYVLNSSL